MFRFSSQLTEQPRLQPDTSLWTGGHFDAVVRHGSRVRAEFLLRGCRCYYFSWVSDSLVCFCIAQLCNDEFKKTIISSSRKSRRVT